MTDKEQIKELENIIDRYYHPSVLAADVYNAGYRKTIWHKVTDGDLPKNYKKVAFLDVNYEYYIGTYTKKDETFHTYIGFDISKNYVIAWAELPKYEEK